jgi:oxygen-independent coproporphyrinogen-3 oxidase
MLSAFKKRMEPLWKPFLHRAVTGRWELPRLTAMKAPWPSGLQHAGLYLHVPFCRNLCPFCPYNRKVHTQSSYARFEHGVHTEIDLYAPHLKGTKIDTLYIGGGTPTVDPEALVRMVRHIREAFPGSYDGCVELHPANMDDACLDLLRGAGITRVSIGVESTTNRLLTLLGRSQTAESALGAVRRAVAAGFESVNVDLMFALPTQTLAEWRSDLEAVLSLGVDQVSTYPLFGFPYSERGLERKLASIERPSSSLIRSMLALTQAEAARHHLKQCAVWSWIRPGRSKFSSITRHHYVGFGPSAASMIGTAFYVNTFDVDAYADALTRGRPVALILPVDRRLEMAYWLYWRVYELKVAETEFQEIFGPDASLEATFGSVTRLFKALRMVEGNPGGWHITRRGAYWIHRLQNEYSLNYINRLWGACRREAWPREVRL